MWTESARAILSKLLPARPTSCPTRSSAVLSHSAAASDAHRREEWLHHEWNEAAAHGCGQEPAHAGTRTHPVRRWRRSGDATATPAAAAAAVPPALPGVAGREGVRSNLPQRDGPLGVRSHKHDVRVAGHKRDVRVSAEAGRLPGISPLLHHSRSRVQPKRLRGAS